MRSSSQFEPERPARDDLPGAETANKPPDRAEHSEILEQVLRETLSLADNDAPVAAAEMARLREAARGRDAALTSAAVQEMVAVVLSTRLGRFIEASRRERMTQAIAETLLDDPRSRQRLEQLWRRLCEAVR